MRGWLKDEKVAPLPRSTATSRALAFLARLLGSFEPGLRLKFNSNISNQSEQNFQTGSIDKKEKSIAQVISDLENVNAHLYSIEALMERIFDVKVPDEVEDTFREVAGELAPDPLNIDRLRLNRLLHQTPDLPDK